MAKTPPKGVYPVDKVILKKRGQAKTCTRLRQIRSALGKNFDLDNLSNYTVIVDYIVNGETQCTLGIAAPHQDKGKVRVVATSDGDASGTFVEQRGKLMFEVG